jgi:hypothetical protein
VTAPLTPLPADAGVRPTGEGDEKPNAKSVTAPADASAKVTGTSTPVAASAGEKLPADASASPGEAAPGTTDKVTGAANGDVAGVERDASTRAADGAALPEAKPKVAMPLDIIADMETRLRSPAPSGGAAETLPKTNGSSSLAVVDVLPVSTKVSVCA